MNSDMASFSEGDDGSFVSRDSRDVQSIERPGNGERMLASVVFIRFLVLTPCTPRCRAPPLLRLTMIRGLQNITKLRLASHSISKQRLIVDTHASAMHRPGTAETFNIPNLSMPLWPQNLYRASSAIDFDVLFVFCL